MSPKACVITDLNGTHIYLRSTIRESQPSVTVTGEMYDIKTPITMWEDMTGTRFPLTTDDDIVPEVHAQGTEFDHHPWCISLL